MLNLAKINNAIINNGGQIEAKSILNLGACPKISLMTGEENHKMLKWKNKPLSLKARWHNFFSKEKILPERYLAYELPSIFNMDEVYESVEDFNKKNYPEREADENLIVRIRPHITLHFEGTKEKFYYDTIEETLESLLKLKEIYKEAGFPVIETKDYDLK